MLYAQEGYASLVLAIPLIYTFLSLFLLPGFYRNRNFKFAE